MKRCRITVTPGEIRVKHDLEEDAYKRLRQLHQVLLTLRGPPARFG